MQRRLRRLFWGQVGSQPGQRGSWRAAAIAMAIAILLTTPGCRRFADYPMSDAAPPQDLLPHDRQAPPEGTLPADGPHDILPSPPDITRDSTKPRLDIQPPDSTKPQPDGMKPPVDTRPAHDVTPPPPDITPDTLPTRPACTTQCGQHPFPPEDRDCDSLPNARDPKPDTCQPLLLGEDFTTDPSKNIARWTVSKPANVTWKNGSAELAAGTRLTLANQNLLKSTTTGPYLVETHFTLGVATDPKNWSVGIRVGPSATYKFTCTAWMSTKWHGLRPGAHLNIKSCGQDSGTWDQNVRGPGTGAKGESYILQFWYDTQAHCRLLFDDKGKLKPQSQSNSYTCAVTRPDTFSVYTSQRAATLHTIRAFAFPN